MKTVVFSTSTGNTDVCIGGLEYLGWGPVVVFRYDVTGSPMDRQMIEFVRKEEPDFLVYISAHALPYIPSDDAMAKMNLMAPMVHLCFDGGDPPWHDDIPRMREAGCFTMQVNIDGNRNWPSAPGDITCLAPMDPGRFHPSPWDHRNVQCGFGGNLGSPHRQNVMGMLSHAGDVTIHPRSDAPGSHEAYARFLGRCRIVLNTCRTGSDVTTHVKGRIVEIGYSGAMLLEEAGSPTGDWFCEGVDFETWRSVKEAHDKIGYYTCHPAETEAMATRLQRKIMKRHSPRAFWLPIVERCGIKIPQTIAA